MHIVAWLVSVNCHKAGSPHCKTFWHQMPKTYVRLYYVAIVTIPFETGRETFHFWQTHLPILLFKITLILLVRIFLQKHRKNCKCCPVSQLIVRLQWLSWIQDLNCQNCNQCLKCHKSPGLSYQLSKWQKQLSELSSIVKIVKKMLTL